MKSSPSNLAISLASGLHKCKYTDWTFDLAYVAAYQYLNF